MTAWAHADTLDNGLAYIKSNGTKLLLLKTYAFGDSYATVLGNKLAEATMASTDYTLSTSSNNRVLTSASGKTGTATASSTQYSYGTASGGSTSSLSDASKSWTTNEHAGRAIKITGGTGSGQYGTVASNTATAATLVGTWAVAPDATSTYRICDNIHYAITDGTAKVLWVTEDSSKQVVTAGNLESFPQLTYASNQPTVP